MRFKRVRVSSEFFANMLREGQLTSVVCVKGLPNDAKFSHITSSQIAGLDLVFYSQEWPELKDGDEYPVIEVLFEKYDPEDYIKKI